MIRYAWEIFTVWSLAAVGLAACFDRYRRRQRRNTAAARKRAVLHSIEHSESVVPIVRGHAKPLPRKDARP